jgi:hypothetical protein
MKAKQFPVIHFASKFEFLRILMVVIGGVLIITDLTIGHSAIADPYAWSMV